MSVISVHERNFTKQVLESEVPVVVDFYADWCGPCRQVAPAVETLAREWEGRVLFAKLNIDDNAALAQAYRVASIPAVLLFEDGEVSAWSIGAKPGYVIERELGLRKRAGHKRRDHESRRPDDGGLDGAVGAGGKENDPSPAAGLVAAARAWWGRQ